MIIDMDKLTCTNCGKDNKTNAKYCSDCGHELPKIKTDIVQQQLQQNDSEKTDKRKKLIVIVVGAVAFGLSYFAVQQIFFAPPSIDKILMQTASEINKTCPVMVDQFTRMDNSLALPNNSFQYNYTIVNNDKSEINLDTAKKYIEPAIINQVKTDPDLKFFRDNKVTMIYNYRDKSGVFVVKYSVTPDMYKE
jgi:ribosomal protein L37E